MDTRKQKIVIVGSYSQVERAREAAKALALAGYEPWCFWLHHTNPLQGCLDRIRSGDPENPLTAAAWERLQQAKLDCVLAIMEARCLVLVEPCGRDSHYQAGFAMARGIPTVQFAPHGRRTGLMTFENLVAYTEGQLVGYVGEAIRAAMPGSKRPSCQCPEELPLAIIGQGCTRRTILPSDLH